MGFKKDLASIEYATDIFSKIYTDAETSMHEEEDNGLDFSGYTHGLMYPVEVKTWNSEFKTMEGRNYGWTPKFIFDYTPSKGADISGFRCPSQDTLNRYSSEPVYNYRRYMEISVSSNRKLDGEMFIPNPDSGKFLTKWLKLNKYDNASLMVIFRDGVVFFDNDMLRKSFVGYCYCKEERTNGSGEYLWQLKALIDLDKGRFYEEEVPPEIFTKKKTKYFN